MKLKLINKFPNTHVLLITIKYYITIIVPRNIAQWFGFDIAIKNDNYSPLPDINKLRKNLRRWNVPSSLGGVFYNIKEIEFYLGKLLHKYSDELRNIPSHRWFVKKNFGEGFPPIDGMLLYMMVRDLKPRKYVEIGSGFSTYYCSLAAQKNRDDGYPMEIFCIEPNPVEKLFKIPFVKVIKREVQDVSITFFEKLRANDILLIDSTHIVKIDGDVPYIYLEILPTLKKGVMIHAHDIPFPFNIPYPPEFHILRKNIWPVFWNEAMLAQAFLAFNSHFRIIMSMPLLRYHDERFLKSSFPNYEPINKTPDTFSSLWFQKIRGHTEK